MNLDFLPHGRMLNGTKTQRPGHVRVFNANIFAVPAKGKPRKIWFGDLDLTTDREQLLGLAKAEGETLKVLKEHDGRFTNEDKPRLDKAVATIEADGSYTVHEEAY